MQRIDYERFHVDEAPIRTPLAVHASMLNQYLSMVIDQDTITIVSDEKPCCIFGRAGKELEKLNAYFMAALSRTGREGPLCLCCNKKFIPWTSLFHTGDLETHERDTTYRRIVDVITTVISIEGVCPGCSRHMYTCQAVISHLEHCKVLNFPIYLMYAILSQTSHVDPDFLYPFDGFSKRPKPDSFQKALRVTLGVISGDIQPTKTMSIKRDKRVQCELIGEFKLLRATVTIKESQIQMVRDLFDECERQFLHRLMDLGIGS